MTPKLLEWLDKQGYPLEMKVAKLFIEKGFAVRHSPYYLDQDTETRREIDLIASVVLGKDDKATKFSIVIECKNNNDKPWVSFCSKRHSLHPIAYIVQKCATRTAQQILDAIAKKDHNFEDGFLFTHPVRPAYNITQAFENGGDKTYAAMYSASKASWSLIKPNLTQINYAEIVIPLIVIGGKLFESYLDDNGDFQVEEVNRSTIIWNNPVVGMPHTTLFIETYEKLSERIDVYKKDIKEFQRLREELFPQIIL